MLATNPTEYENKCTIAHVACILACDLVSKYALLILWCCCGCRWCVGGLFRGHFVLCDVCRHEPVSIQRAQGASMPWCTYSLNELRTDTASLTLVTRTYCSATTYQSMIIKLVRIYRLLSAGPLCVPGDATFSRNYDWGVNDRCGTLILMSTVSTATKYADLATISCNIQSFTYDLCS